MKIVSTKKDADTLIDGEQYVIQPKGFDPSKPENIFEFLTVIDELQNYVENRFKVKDDKVKQGKKNA